MLLGSPTQLHWERRKQEREREALLTFSYSSHFSLGVRQVSDENILVSPVELLENSIWLQPYWRFCVRTMQQSQFILPIESSKIISYCFKPLNIWLVCYTTIGNLFFLSERRELQEEEGGPLMSDIIMVSWRERKSHCISQLRSHYCPSNIAVSIGRGGGGGHRRQIGSVHKASKW